MSRRGARRPESGDRMSTVQETADRLGMSGRQVRRWIEQDLLKVHHFGRAIRIAEEDYQDFRRRCRGKAK
jgi:excisionase family DNA binding protein